MNRLRDEYPEDPLAEEGIALLRATAPTRPMPDAKRRVWISLWAAGATAMPRPRRRRLVATPAFVLIVVGISAAATAGAVIGRHWMAPASEAGAAAAATAAVSRRPMARPSARSQPSAFTGVPGASSEGAGAGKTAASSASSDRAVVESSATSLRRSVARSGGRGSGSASSGSGLQTIAGAGPKSEVLEALIALRRDGEPVRAGALLDRYLRANPRGTLREEALVLAIEAAGARGDAPAAERFARAYRAGYPMGRFRAFADSHLPSLSPSPSRRR